jgi:hypothetical protein
MMPVVRRPPSDPPGPWQPEKYPEERDTRPTLPAAKEKKEEAHELA